MTGRGITVRASVERPPLAGTPDRTRATPSVLASLRVRQWLHFTLLPLAGFEWSLGLRSASACARGVAIAAAILAFGYLLNGLGDRATDRDRDKNPLAGYRGPTTRYWVAVVAAACAALALAASGPGIALAATLVALGCGTVYSVGPRLKSVPGVGTLLNVGCFAPLLFVGLADGTSAAPQWALASVFTGLLLQNQLIHEAVDRDEDRAAGVASSYRVLGPRRAAWLALALGVTVLLASGAMASARAVTPLVALHALPYLTVFPLLIARSSAEARAMARLRLIHRGCAVGSGALMFLIAVLP